MFQQPRNTFRASPEYHALLREIGLGPEEVFTHPDIRVWRKLPDRENCTLECVLQNGSSARLHIKRYEAVQYGANPAEVEADGIRALIVENIPTAPLVGWGKLLDGRSFVITEDLAGFRAADKLIADGMMFARLLEPTAQLAALLHNRGLHHRDLYLCHFFVKTNNTAIDIRLIDAARVKRLPQWLFRGRWIVKDLGQFWYSAMQLNIPTEDRRRWLEVYAAARQVRNVDALQRKVEAKAAWIEKHDRKLRARQPGRNVSIPGA